MPPAFSPIIIIKPLLWIVVILVSVYLLRKQRVTKRIRLIFILLGIVVFGILFGIITAGGFDPNPVIIVRNVLTFITGNRPANAPQLLIVSGGIVLVILLTVSLISNKSVCGWICHLGLLQDLLHRVPLPKWKPSFRVSNSIRIVSFLTLLTGLLISGLDWIGYIDPFEIFHLNITAYIGVFFGLLLILSIFIYRPWCQLLCPFGLLSWIMEQFSLFRPRINRDKCKQCELCTKACPTSAMSDFYKGKNIHADCFACGACINACPQKEALQWRRISK